MNAFQSRQKGSAVILILIGVALFAALIFTLMRNGDSNISTMSKQQAKIAAQEMLSFGSALSRAVQKLIMRGCSETQLDFSNTVWRSVNENVIYAPGHNPRAPASGCSVFDPDEGGITPSTFEKYADLSIAIPSGTKWGHGTIYAARIEGVGTAGREEIYLQVPPIKKEVCVAINDLMGVNNPGGSPPSGTSAITHYDGAFEETTVLDSPDDSFAGKTGFCYFSSSRYRFAYVLVER